MSPRKSPATTAPSSRPSFSSSTATAASSGSARAAAIVIGVTLPEGALLLPYLLVPALLAGIYDGRRGTVLVVGGADEVAVLVDYQDYH